MAKAVIITIIFFSVDYYNLNNLLKKADCYYVSNNCKHNKQFLVVDCSSNYTAENVSIISSTSNSTNTGKSSSSTSASSNNNCILVQNSNSSSNSKQLYCKVLFNITNNDYLYAFIAAIVLILVLFCMCPLCCIYYYCCHYKGGKMMENNSMFNRYKKNKCEKK